MIVVGASLGGVQALQRLLGGLDVSMQSSIVVALHRHRDSDAGLIETLQRTTRLHIVEAVDKMQLAPATVYLAPADYHVLIDGDCISLSVDDPVRFARPSIDVLFESAAALASRVTAVVLTGGGSDGAIGAAAVESRGGRVIVQTPAEAQCADMPQAAIAATRRPLVMNIEQIAEKLIGALIDE